jgi:hypothetical protein
MDFRKKQYERLVKTSDFMFDLSKVAFGALIGGLAAFVGQRAPEAPPEHALQEPPPEEHQ